MRTGMRWASRTQVPLQLYLAGLLGRNAGTRSSSHLRHGSRVDRDDIATSACDYGLQDDTDGINDDSGVFQQYERGRASRSDGIF